MANPLQQLAALGQSVWLDYIHRDLFDGQLRRLIEQDALTGMTSNPAIFEKAIDSGHSYDAQILALAHAGKSANDVYEAISQSDVRQAADALRPIYERTHAADGYVSLEVNPHLARDRAGTIAEARRLWAALERPNAYIKVPGTAAGLGAIRQLISEGINVNVTLLFALPRYHEVIDAYVTGLEQRLAAGGSIERVSSVASFFISRIDSMVDPLLQARAAAERDAQARARAESACGEVAIACGKLAYNLYRQSFAQERFRRLAAHGARVQRLLWASTSTKNPQYPDVKYVEALLGADTIDTMPLETLEAYRDHGRPQLRIEQNLPAARELFESLPGLGVDIDQVTRRLEEEGIDKFIQPFDHLLQQIGARMASAGGASGAQRAAPTSR
ncbi:MAG TPA: transaldolase [Steroidobacteraceae bacterium]|nr:transaldolase [Steroidobacteraceae bacterium]